MEHLTKQQIILLALLVSFSTAVATGITIFSLADNSLNPGVQQIAYRVIEKTISQVASDSPVRKIIPDIVSNTVAQESQALSISDIADKTSGSLIRIYRTIAGTTTPEFVTLGVMTLNNNIIGADGTNLSTSFNYVTVLSDNKQYQISFIKELGGGLSLFKLTDESAAKIIPTIKTLPSTKLKIGFNVVSIGGDQSSNVVSTGIIKQISSVPLNDKTVSVLITDFKPTTSASSLILLDTNANLIGFYAPALNTVGVDEGSFMAVDSAISLVK
ncbi:MAG: hypothetical protein WCV55_02105 [Candidatus Paceibacterota bacterium]